MRSDLDFINGSHLLIGALRLDAGLLCIINTDRGRGVNLLKAMAGYGTRFDPAGKEGAPRPSPCSMAAPRCSRNCHLRFMWCLAHKLGCQCRSGVTRVAPRRSAAICYRLLIWRDLHDLARHDPRKSALKCPCAGFPGSVSCAAIKRDGESDKKIGIHFVAGVDIRWIA
ncbi:hypothetical protein [Ralstonia solanacearum]|uniref:hypothetical protein n=1 Tax=Ralstonia solanacearum TaxID=305 RepID=UPI001FFBC5A6